MEVTVASKIHQVALERTRRQPTRKEEEERSQLVLHRNSQDITYKDQSVESGQDRQQEASGYIAAT